MQVTTEATEAAAGTLSPKQIETGSPADGRESSELAADLYALVVYLHKNCTADLFEALGALDVTMSQTKLLQKLEHADGDVTLKHAAEMLRLSLPAVSRAVDDLVRRGMVERHEDVEDRRMKRILLTDTGRAIISKLNGARLQGLEEFTRTLNDDERQALVGALTQLLQRPDVAVCRPEGQLNP